MGQQSFIAFVAISVVSIGSSGLNVALLRYVGEIEGRGESAVVRALFRWAWRIEGAVAALGGAALLALGSARGELRGAWALAALVVVGGILHSVPSAILYGLQRWREASVVGLVTGAASTAATIVVLALDGGIVGMFAVEAAIGAVNLVWTSAIANRAVRAVPAARTLDPALTRAVRSYAWIVSLDVMLTYVVWRRSEFFFLERYTVDAQIAHYSVAFAAVNVLARIPDAVGMVLAPAVANLLGAGQDGRIRAGYTRAVRLVVQLMLPMTAGAMALGPAALRLVYGRDYSDAGPVMVILLSAFLAVPLFNLTSGLLTGLGRARVLLMAVLVAAVVNISLDILLIPDHEAVGAAVANGTAQLTAAVFVVAYVLARVGSLSWGVATIGRTAVAAVASGVAALVAVRSLGDLPGVLVGTVAGAAVFTVVAAAIGVVDHQDREWLHDSLLPRLPGRVAGVARPVIDRFSG
jgi:O-antigen/teichoic acid export membrane protein